jgi:predicted YcjX-like family ATPase
MAARTRSRMPPEPSRTSPRQLHYGARRGVLAHAAAGILRGATAILPVCLAKAGRAAADRVGGSRIGRVVFVATKADHVLALKRNNLRHLLRSLAGATESRQTMAGAQVSYQVAASLRSTEDDVALLDGRPVQVVKGRVIGEDKVRPFYVGDVPVAMPPENFWTDGFFELPRFRPPPIDPSGRDGLPHLGLDAVLEELLGDLL